MGSNLSYKIINLFENYEKKNSIANICILHLDTKFCAFRITGGKVANSPPPFYGARKRQGLIFTWGQHYNKYPKRNMFAKFDTSIRDVNVWFILYHNSLGNYGKLCAF